MRESMSRDGRSGGPDRRRRPRPRPPRPLYDAPADPAPAAAWISGTSHSGSGMMMPWVVEPTRGRPGGKGTRGEGREREGDGGGRRPHTPRWQTPRRGHRTPPYFPFCLSPAAWPDLAPVTEATGARPPRPERAEEEAGEREGEGGAAGRRVEGAAAPAAGTRRREDAMVWSVGCVRLASRPRVCVRACGRARPGRCEE